MPSKTNVAANNSSKKVKRSNTISAQMPDLPTILERTWLPSPLPGRLSPSRRLQNPDVSWAELHHPFGCKVNASTLSSQVLPLKFSCWYSSACAMILNRNCSPQKHGNGHSSWGLTLTPWFVSSLNSQSQELDNFHFPPPCCLYTRSVGVASENGCQS